MQNRHSVITATNVEMLASVLGTVEVQQQQTVAPWQRLEDEDQAEVQLPYLAPTLATHINRHGVISNK